MNLFECIMRNSTCYKGTVKGTPVGILWHDTAAGNPKIARYVQPYKGDENYDEKMAKLGSNRYKNDWNHKARQAGVNAFIGQLANGSVATCQVLPWDYMPWGCGGGSKGSCNGDYDGPDYRFWIQFEICDDGYQSKDYFNKVYKEACEFTAYICKMYNIDPNGSVMYNGVQIPTILCHADACKLGFGSNHGDVYRWFNKFGKSMKDVRSDVAKILAENVKPVVPETPAKPEASPATPSETYRVRKSWDDAKSQIGAYSNLENAKNTCDEAGYGYYVFNNAGKVVYPVVAELYEGDEVKLVPGAKYANGKSIASWVFKKTLYVRGFKADGTVIISTLKTGAITGTVARKYLTKNGQATVIKPPVVEAPAKLALGDVVKLVSGAKYASGKSIPAWVFKKNLYVRYIDGENVTISTLKTGAVTGTVNKKYLTKV